MERHKSIFLPDVTESFSLDLTFSLDDRSLQFHGIFLSSLFFDFNNRVMDRGMCSGRVLS